MSRFLRNSAGKEASKLQIINPYTNRIAYEIPFQSLEERLAAVTIESPGLKDFKKLPTSKRIDMLENVIGTFNKERDILSKMITVSTGKPIT